MKSLFWISAVVAGCAFGQRQAIPLVLPDDVALRKVDILSEGTRMAGEVYALKSMSGAKLPAIIMSHGWGGTVAGLRRDAAAFGQSGYLVVAFDYRGWGASDSRVILTGPAPAGSPTHRFTAEVQEVHEVVDPMDMCADILNALHWVQSEPQCDTARIGCGEAASQAAW